MKDTWEKTVGGRSFYFRAENGRVMVADYRVTDNPHTHVAGYMMPPELMEEYSDIFKDLFGEKELKKLIQLLKVNESTE